MALMDLSIQYSLLSGALDPVAECLTVSRMLNLVVERHFSMTLKAYELGARNGDIVLP